MTVVLIFLRRLRAGRGVGFARCGVEFTGRYVPFFQKNSPLFGGSGGAPQRDFGQKGLSDTEKPQNYIDKMTSLYKIVEKMSRLLKKYRRLRGFFEKKY